MSKIKEDITKFSEMTEKYGGEKKAHMVFLFDSGKREYCMGGNSQELCAGILELLTNITAYIVPREHRRDFMESLIRAADDMVSQIEKAETKLN